MPTQDLAARIYERARMSMQNPLGVGWLAIALLGDGALQYAETSQRADVVLVSSPWRLLCSRGLDEKMRSVPVARAIVEWWIATGGAEPKDGLLDVVSVELVLPAPAFFRAAERLHRDPRALARLFVCPEDVVAKHLCRFFGTRRASGMRRRFSAAS